MDFDLVNKEAADYLQKSNCGLKITRVDKERCQIHLLTKDNFTFYISCPSADSSSWTVWSDTEGSLKAMEYVMDVCEFKSCESVSSVLEKVSKSLQMASGMKSYSCGASKDDGGNDCSNDDDEDDGEDLNDYYGSEDYDAQVDHHTTKTSKERETEDSIAANFFNSTGSQMAVNRLVKDLRAIRNDSANYGILATPRDNNLFSWDVKLTDIPKETKLGRDLWDYARRYKEEAVINLDMQFPSDYPYSPPFIRVVKPRFQFMTGHVTLGGSICMEMLTKSGWLPVNDIESILVQVRTEILSDPKASLDMSHCNREYTESEARDAFQRMVSKYGW